MNFGVKSIVSIIFIIGLFSHGYAQNNKNPAKSIISVGMPLSMAMIAIHKEASVCLHMVFPKDPDNWKRYGFTEKNHLLLISKWEDVHGLADNLKHEVIEKIRLVPNWRKKGELSSALTVFVVDLRTKDFY